MRLSVLAGEMRTPVDLQEDVGGEIADDGTTGQNWVTRARINARKEQLSSGEEVIFDRKVAVATYRYTTWMLTSVKPVSGWRIKDGDEYAYLVGPPNNVKNQNRVWELICSSQPTSK
jgi:hypothetical protein